MGTGFFIALLDNFPKCVHIRKDSHRVGAYFLLLRGGGDLTDTFAWEKCKAQHSKSTFSGHFFKLFFEWTKNCI